MLFNLLVVRFHKFRCAVDIHLEPLYSRIVVLLNNYLVFLQILFLHNFCISKVSLQSTAAVMLKYY